MTKTHDNCDREVELRLASTAHELSAPISLIRGSLENLLEEIDELDWLATHAGDVPSRGGRTLNGLVESTRSLLQICRESTEQLSHVVAALRGQTLSPSPARTADLDRAVALAIRLAEQGRDAALRVDCDIPPDLPRVDIDPQVLVQICANLIGNAADAVAANADPQVRLAARAIGGNGSGAAPGVEIRVGDNGDGVPEGLRERIFEPFFTTKARGRGLGLAIARQLVERGGGRLRLETPSGGGAEFVVWLAAPGL